MGHITDELRSDTTKVLKMSVSSGDSNLRRELDTIDCHDVLSVIIFIATSVPIKNAIFKAVDMPYDWSYDLETRDTRKSPSKGPINVFIYFRVNMSNHCSHTTDFNLFSVSTCPIIAPTLPNCTTDTQIATIGICGHSFFSTG